MPVVFRASSNIYGVLIHGVSGSVPAPAAGSQLLFAAIEDEAAAVEAARRAKADRDKRLADKARLFEQQVRDKNDQKKRKKATAAAAPKLKKNKDAKDAVASAEAALVVEEIPAAFSGEGGSAESSFVPPSVPPSVAAEATADGVGDADAEDKKKDKDDGESATSEVPLSIEHCRESLRCDKGCLRVPP